jgi:hypothetical protein
VNPPAIERAGSETPHLQQDALDLYPNPLSLFEHFGQAINERRLRWEACPNKTFSQALNIDRAAPWWLYCIDHGETALGGFAR